METRALDGLVFSRAEFLTLLAAVNPSDLIGIDGDALIPNDKEQHRALVAEGIEELRARGLLTTQGDTHLISDELLVMMGIVAFPQMVTLVIKQTPELGLQQFTYYLAQGFIVEHTMPAPDSYRLASLPSLALWRDRFALLLPVAQEEGQPSYTLAVPQATLTDAQNSAQAGQNDRAFEILTGAGVDGNGAKVLVAAMANPLFSGSAAFLRTEEGEVVDGRDLALLQGEESAWAIYQPEPGGLVTIRTLAGDDLKELFETLATSV